MTDAIADCLAGRISPEVALARLVLSGLSPSCIASLLPQYSALATLFAAQRDNLGATARMLAAAGVDHRGARTPDAIAAMFDRAVAASPDASVAAYTLGDPALLARATVEITDWLLALGAVPPGAQILDLGCGTGRMAAALAPHAAAVLGLDVSPGMIAEAQRRHAHLPNLRFAVTNGAPPDLPDATLDLVLAVDSFPYLVQANLAEAHTARAAAALRPNGCLAILNLSYEDPASDLARAQDFANRFNLKTVILGERPFALWDGTAFMLRKQAVAE